MTARLGWYAADGLGLLALLVLSWKYIAAKPKRPPLPPGPKPLPILGNLFDVPKSFAWRQYQRWAAEYGDIISITILGQVVVILNSANSIQNFVLSTRASAISSRPFIKTAEMTLLHQETLFLMPYGKKWRDRRRVIDRFLRPAAVRAYHVVLQDRVTTAMKRLAHDSSHFRTYIRECTNAVILSTVYGYDVKGGADPFVTMAEELAHLSTQILMPGELIVNAIPILGALPTWVFGSRFAYLIKRVKYLSSKTIHDPFDWVQNALTNGIAKPSLVREALAELPDGDAEAELVLREAFGAIFGAASDTTVSLLSSFILAMTLYPDVQAKAQAQIDMVVCRDRLPAFSDRANLPYIEALLTEIVRWSPVAPLGVPHTVDEDLVWEGYFIPKGATVLGNSWAILHDPATFPEPEAFKPERFVSQNGEYIENATVEHFFGFGARKCPGRYFFDAMLYLFATTILAEFDIAGERPPDDLPICEAFQGNGLVIHPLPFDCRILPRDDRAQQLLESA